MSQSICRQGIVLINLYLLGVEKPSSTSLSQPSTPEVNPQSAEKDPYQTFLVEQQNRDGKWSANREASRVKKKTNVTSDETRDKISILKQQLQAKDRECALLRDQLRGQERLCKVNTCISNVSASNVLTRFNSCRVIFPSKTDK